MALPILSKLNRRGLALKVNKKKRNYTRFVGNYIVIDENYQTRGTRIDGWVSFSLVSLIFVTNILRMKTPTHWSRVLISESLQRAKRPPYS